MGIWRDDVPGDGFSFGRWLAFHQYISGYDNGRIANAFSPLSTSVSPVREIFPLVTGVLAAFCVVMVRRFACPSARQSRALMMLALTWALMIVSLPWRDTLFVRDYSLNYIWSAALTLALLWFLRLTCRRRSPAIFAVALVLAAIAGGWHESFAVETLCGLALVAAARRFRLPGRFYAATAVYLASTLYLMLTPGMIHRMGIHVGTLPSVIAIRNYFVVLVLGVVVLCLLFARDGRRALAELLRSDTGLVCIGILVSGYVVAIFAANTARSYFWPDMAAVVMILRLMARLPGRFPVRWQYWIAGVVMAACTAQTLSVIWWQRKYAEESDRIMELVEQSETGVVVYDLTLPTRAPFYTLDIPVSDSWVNPWNLSDLRNYTNRPITVVPSR